MGTMEIVWLSALVFFVIVEAMTVQLVCVWFSASALIALLLALLGVPEYVQIIAFFVCTALLLIFTRPIVKRIMKKPAIHTNADRVIGATAIVIQGINNDLDEGQVKVLNQVWTARSLGGEAIPIDTKVVVHSIEGVKVMVERLKEGQI